MTTHQSEVICLPQSGITIRCFLDYAEMPHWTLRMGHAPTIDEIHEVWLSHLEQSGG